MTDTTDPNARTCPRRNAPCARGCGNQVCKSQAEADMGLNMPPMILPRETAKAFAASVQQYFSESGIIIGRMAEFELPRPTITLGSITITPDGVTYNGETVKDAGAVHAALLDVLNGKPLPLAAPAPAANPSMAGAAAPSAWMHEDGRVVTAATMAGARKDGGAMLSSLRGYTIPLFAAPVAQSTAGDAKGDYVLMPKRLTAENGAKGALSGEFHEYRAIECPECLGNGDDSYGEDCPECNGEGNVLERVTVEWDTIKRIYASAVDLLAAPAAQAPMPTAAEVRNQALEEAARVVLDGSYWNGAPASVYATAVDRATAIRALRTASKEGGAA